MTNSLLKYLEKHAVFSDFPKDVSAKAHLCKVSEESPDVTVLQDVIYCPAQNCLYSQDGQRIESSRIPIPYDNGYRLEGELPSITIAADVTVFYKPVLYLGCMPYHYGHFLLEGLARMWKLTELTSDTPILLHPKPPGSFRYNEFISEFLFQSLIAERLIRFQSQVRFKELILPSPSFVVRRAAWRNHGSLPRLMAERIADEKTTEQPLYFSRIHLQDADKILNENILIEALESRGVKVVSPERLPLTEQIKLVNTHSTVIGYAGSALHNALWRKGNPLKIIHLCSSGYLNPNYFLLSWVTNSHPFFFCCTEQADKPSHREDLNVDLAVEQLTSHGILSAKPLLKKKAPPIAVIGMHRSGTSCLAGSLQARGLYLGEVNQIAPHNPRGNRENSEVQQLNDEVIVFSGGIWNKPPEVIKWDSALQQRRDDIISRFESESTERWGFKDPRTTITLPFWMDGIPKLQPVGTFRNPRHVVASLITRAQKISLDLSIEEALLLWIRYNQKLLEHHEQFHFPIICFDLPDPEYLNSVSAVAEMFSLNKGKETFFQSELRTTTLLDENIRDNPLTPEALDIYDRLSDLCLKPSS